MAIVTGKGKKIIIQKAKKPLGNGYPLILENDITISLSSSFSSLLGGADTKLFNVIGAITRDFGFGFSGQFKQLGFQVWDKSDPISISGITVGFEIDKYNVNAFEQVYKPILELMQLPLPGEGSGGNLIPPGASLLELFKEEGNKNLSKETISVQLANILYIPSAIILKAEPTFSNETDDNDYPIWGKISLDIQSIYSATREAVEQRTG